MKYFFPILMGITIASGVILTVTPFVGALLFPPVAVGLQKTSEVAVRRALSDWFVVPMDEINAAHGIRQRQGQTTWDWYRFSLPRAAVERFIIRGQLRQLELSADLMQQTFLHQAPAVDWWQPQALGRETYFLGVGGGRELALIYNAEQGLGYMRITSQNKFNPAGF